MIQPKKHHFVSIALVFLLLQSCAVKKFIPEGELLYTGAEVELEPVTKTKDADALKADLQKVLRPEPNSKILGLRPGLSVHYKAQRGNPGFLNKWLNKKIGEEPVYLSDVAPFEIEKILKNRLENRGFFYTSVRSAVNRDEEDKTGNIQYTVRVPKPYTLEKYRLDNDTLPIYKEIGQIMETTPIKPGLRFDLSKMKLERERIDQKLKAKGYYNFNDNFIIFEADTNQYDNKRFDLFLKLKKDVPQKATVPYRIKNVNIFPNYVVGQDSAALDTTRFERKNYIQDTLFFKPKRLDPFVLIDEGDLYSPKISKSTSRRLTSIGAYKYVNIQYKELPGLAMDSLQYLEANILLSPLNKRALRAELQAITKSNNFAGPRLVLTYANRNLFKGGETLNLSATLGYEVQLAGGNQSGLTSIELGLRADLLFPRMLLPFDINEDWFEYTIPRTKISMGVDYLSRSQLYTLTSATATFGYIWQANRYVTHEINPISINYVRLGNVTEEFQKILEDNPFLRTSFDQEFISGLTYSFTYNGMVDTGRTHQIYTNFNFDTAGNSIDLLSGGSGERPYEFLSLVYAQYAKADVDLRYHFNFGKEQKIATRLFAGLGLPYGNSEVVPFSKQYFSGGPYSVRAFKIRSLGPGTYNPENVPQNEPNENNNGINSFFDRTGNIRLEANIEYRFPLFSYLKGAIFADAGNVWNTDENAVLPGGKFSSNFADELGIGGGIGLRVDVQGFVIRFDLAAPFHDPQLPEGERWDFNFAEPVFNFAIGYPF